MRGSARDDGVTALEYALVASLIFLVIIAAVILVGETLTDFFCYTADWFGWVTDQVFGEPRADTPEGVSGSCERLGVSADE